MLPYEGTVIALATLLGRPASMGLRHYDRRGLNPAFVEGLHGRHR